MPSTSKKQERVMAAIAHGWKPPKGSGLDIPIGVAKDFNRADQNKSKGILAIRNFVWKTP